MRSLHVWTSFPIPLTGGALMALLLLAPAVGAAKKPAKTAKGPSLQSQLQGDWVRADRNAYSLTFVPWRARDGHVGVGDEDGVDYSYYRLLGKDRIRIKDLNTVYRIRVQGTTLRVWKPGSRAAEVYVRSKNSRTSRS